MESLGFTDVYHEEKDYFTYEMPGRYLIDNPPFSIKKKVIQYAYDRGIPFALLMPLDTMGRKYFQKFTTNFQIIFFSGRILEL